MEVKISVNTDASAAKGIAHKRGVGKVRHIEVSQLWVQDKVATGKLSIRKVGTKDNVADMLTKHISRQPLDRHLGSLPLRWSTSRAASAPKV